MLTMKNWRVGASQASEGWFETRRCLEAPCKMLRSCRERFVALLGDSFGESHGPAYGGVVDGCPPGWRCLR